MTTKYHDQLNQQRRVPQNFDHTEADVAHEPIAAEQENTAKNAENSRQYEANADDAQRILDAHAEGVAIGVVVAVPVRMLANVEPRTIRQKSGVRREILGLQRGKDRRPDSGNNSDQDDGKDHLPHDFKNARIAQKDRQER